MSQKMAMQVSEESKICFVIERYRQKLLLWIKGQLRLDYIVGSRRSLKIDPNQEYWLGTKSSGNPSNQVNLKGTTFSFWNKVMF